MQPGFNHRTMFPASPQPHPALCIQQRRGSSETGTGHELQQESQSQVHGLRTSTKQLPIFEDVTATRLDYQYQSFSKWSPRDKWNLTAGAIWRIKIRWYSPQQWSSKLGSYPIKVIVVCLVGCNKASLLSKSKNYRSWETVGKHAKIDTPKATKTSACTQLQFKKNENISWNMQSVFIFNRSSAVAIRIRIAFGISVFLLQFSTRHRFWSHHCCCRSRAERQHKSEGTSNGCNCILNGSNCTRGVRRYDGRVVGLTAMSSTC